MLGVNMASRIENILTRARDTLADPNAERWSDARLLRLLDEAHKDLAKQTKILKGQHTILVEIDVHTYTLPENLWLITRAAYADADIKLVSYDSMDERVRKDRLSERPSDSRERGYGYRSAIDYTINRTWQLDDGPEITALVYDNRNLHDIRVYPIPNAGIADSNYEFTNAGDISFDGDEMLGVVTDITDYTFNTPFGLLAELYEPSIIVETGDVYGVTTAINEAKKAVNIWYIRIPDELTTVDDSLETPTMFDVALKHYIVGHAFRDDLDVQYREMGAESIRLYNRELDVAQETNRTDGTRNATAFTSTYRGGFE